MRNRIEKTAERWFARRMAQPDLPDAAFEAWLTKSPEHERAWRRTVAVWEKLGSALKDDMFADLVDGALEPEGGFASPGPSYRNRRDWISCLRRLFQPAFPRVALALTFVVVLSLIVVPQLYQEVTYTTSAVGEELTLDDGSQVNLDRGSRIRVSIGWLGRKVQLVNGRALFDVAPDKRRPFAVVAGRATIVATGTSFQVDRADDEVSVSLLTGEVLVNVRGTHDPFRLEPGKRLEWRLDDERWQESTIDPHVVTAWTRGFLEFDKTPLVEAVREINRHARIAVYLEGSSLDGFKVSGTFKLGEAQRFAEALPHVLPVEVQVKPARIVITRK